MTRFIFILCIILSLAGGVLAQTEKLTGYRNLNWDTPLNADFTNCTPSQLYTLKQDVLACKYKYDDKTYGYIDNAYVMYMFYNKKLIAVKVGIFNEILDPNIITNKYGKPYIDWGSVKTWHVGDTYIEYTSKGETRNRVTNEVISPIFSSVTYYNHAKYEEVTEKRVKQIYNNI